MKAFTSYFSEKGRCFKGRLGCRKKLSVMKTLHAKRRINKDFEKFRERMCKIKQGLKN